MTPEREQQLREGVGIWAATPAPALECLDAIAALREALDVAEARSMKLEAEIGEAP